MTIPDTLPVLHGGGHDEGSNQLCAMEAAAWLATEKHSDRPQCVHPVIAAMARNVNDSIDDESRQQMWPLIIRSLGTASDDRVLPVRLAIWCASQVLSIYEDKVSGDDRPRKAIEAAQAWAECPCDKHATANAAYAAADAYAAAYAANAAYAAADAYAAANAAAANAANAYANAAAANDANRLSLLSGLIDEYDRLTGRTEYEAPSADAWDRVLTAGGCRG